MTRVTGFAVTLPLRCGLSAGILVPMESPPSIEWHAEIALLRRAREMQPGRMAGVASCWARIQISTEPGTRLCGFVWFRARSVRNSPRVAEEVCIGAHQFALDRRGLLHCDGASIPIGVDESS